MTTSSQHCNPCGTREPPGDTPVAVPYLEWRSVFEDGPYSFAGEPRIIEEAMVSGYDPDRRYLSGGNETIVVIGNLTD